MLTGYDEHLVTYLRLLDAETDGADWTEVARIVLDIDPAREPQRARRAWESHLRRAKWMAERGYRHSFPARRTDKALWKAWKTGRDGPLVLLRSAKTVYRWRACSDG